ncbi:MAG: hypothetical protein Q8N99_03395 [Nanoarchaeota archaeon]|nr:hypothetical protein [Nanoarchaeota archaeon]
MEECQNSRVWCLMYWISGRKYREESRGMELDKEQLGAHIEVLRKRYKNRLVEENVNFQIYLLGSGILKLIKKESSLDNIGFGIELICQTQDDVEKLALECKLPFSYQEVHNIPGFYRISFLG